MRRMNLRSWPKSPERSKAESPRRPVAAGIFYPEEKRSLTDLIDRVCLRHAEKCKAVAVVVPHGGLLDSGAVAGAVYAQVRFPEVAVVIGPSHAGTGRVSGLMARGAWETPLGRLPVDEELAKMILVAAPDLEENSRPHQEEHSIEVQLPFLQYLGKIRAFVPILLSEIEPPAIQRIGRGLAQAVGQRGGEVLLVASTDLTRHEPFAAAQAKDRLALDRILALDEEGLGRVVEERSISMCGAATAAVSIAAAKGIGISGAVLVKYQTSAECTAEKESVVGYAGILLRKG